MTEGIKFDETVPLPVGQYRVEVLTWTRAKSERGYTYAKLTLQIIKGPFAGRKLYYTIASQHQLAIAALHCQIEYSADTTAEALLDSFIDHKLDANVNIRTGFASDIVFNDVSGLSSPSPRPCGP